VNVAAFGLAAILSVGVASACLADDMVAAEQVAGTSIGFVLKGTHSNATLNITGPNNFQASTFSRGGAVAIDLKQFGPLPDGTYNYQLNAANGSSIAAANGLDNGRGNGRKRSVPQSAAKSGTFNVKGGKIVEYSGAAQRGRRGQDAQ
jgi:hypothetical protein